MVDYHNIDCTSASTNGHCWHCGTVHASTVYYSNYSTNESDRLVEEFKQLPRRRIPWEEVQVWAQEEISPQLQDTKWRRAASGIGVGRSSARGC